MKSSRIKLIELMEFLAVEIGRELAAQGHRLTGKLAASLQPRLTGQELTADMVWLAYGEAINNGVHRSRIPFSPGSGKKHSKYIAALIRYVKLRRLKPKNGQTVKSIAFAIAHSQKQTGLPTYASRRHSRTGRRTGAVQEAYSVPGRPRPPMWRKSGQQ